MISAFTLFEPELVKVNEDARVICLTEASPDLCLELSFWPIFRLICITVFIVTLLLYRKRLTSNFYKK